jgi:TPP-dependent pyruvate/acetoin dehydrogenase alpha subunit
VPALFVCENNYWAESTPGKQHSPVWDDMGKRALAYDMKVIDADGQDVEEVYEKTKQALEYVRSGKGPVFMDVVCVRLVGHFVGDPQIYRPKGEVQELRRTRDPITLLREQLDISDDDYEAMDAEATEIAEASVVFAKNGTDPQPEDALKNVYA